MHYLVLTIALTVGEQETQKPAPAAVRVITEALKSAKTADDAALAYRKAVEKLMPLVKSNVAVVEQMKLAQKELQDADPKQAATILRRALVRAKGVLEFKPKMEAPLPKGFPEPTPLGEIRVKRYPSYRLAKAEGGNSFFTLFRHIKKNDIAMTAPVEVTYGTAKGKNLQKASMAFLYENQKQGKTGQQGRVKVIDVPASLAVSIGMRGVSSQEQVAKANRWLREWLSTHRQYAAAGPLRVMAYNSPFVPTGKRYYEVQIPIKQSKN